MSVSSILRLLFSFRFIAALALIWLLYSPSGFAWQQNNYYPYPAYPGAQFRAPVYYPYPPTRFYPAYLAPRYRTLPPPEFRPVNFSAPVKPASTAAIRKQTRSTVPEQDKQAASNKKNHLRKQAFIKRLLPYIETENRRLLEQRKKLQLLFSQLEQQQALSAARQSWMKRLARQYRVQQDPLHNEAARTELLQKIDIIPPSLALAQAANESGWGTSRFATEANNLFGIWTYDASKGIVPKQRSEKKTHLIRKFGHIGESIAYYMHTLNSHPAYQKLRELRHQARMQQQTLNGHLLASGLESYSAKGKQYIELIRQLIRQNQWARLDNNLSTT